MHLRMLDGRLWYGDRLRFESPGLVLVEGGLCFAWGEPWRVAPVHSPMRLGMPMPGAWRTTRAWLGIGPEGAWHRVVTEGWEDTWEELAALVDYLAATPPARPGLDDPARVEALARELSARRWRTPYPPAPPLMGDDLDLHRVVTQVLRRHARYLGERTVRGEPLPPADRVVAEAATALPAWVRRREDTAWIAATVERHLQTGQWPFDVLLSDGAKIPA